MRKRSWKCGTGKFLLPLLPNTAETRFGAPMNLENASGYLPSGRPGSGYSGGTMNQVLEPSDRNLCTIVSQMYYLPFFEPLFMMLLA